MFNVRALWSIATLIAQIEAGGRCEDDKLALLRHRGCEELFRPEPRASAADLGAASGERQAVTDPSDSTTEDSVANCFSAAILFSAYWK